MLLLELEFILLAVEDHLPIVEVLVVGEFHVEIGHAGRMVCHLVDILWRSTGWH